MGLLRRIFAPGRVVKLLTVAAILWGVTWAVLSTDNLRAAWAGETLQGKDIAVVVHGLGRSKFAMWRLAGRLEDSGFEVHRVGYKSLQDTPDEIMADISRQIAHCCLGRSSRVHFVGHSLGGLLIRAYLTDNKPDNLGRVVLIGTPSHGTEIVDNLRHKWWFQVLGPMAASLGTGPDSFPNSIGRPDYPLGVIAGRKTNGVPNEHMLPGEDDGLVSIESTKVDGMADFIVLDVGHSAMRWDADVAKLTAAFLKSGKFAGI